MFKIRKECELKKILLQCCVKVTYSYRASPWLTGSKKTTKLLTGARARAHTHTHTTKKPHARTHAHAQTLKDSFSSPQPPKKLNKQQQQNHTHTHTQKKKTPPYYKPSKILRSKHMTG